jgi:acyl-CoA synthetase (NDP forming)
LNKIFYPNSVAVIGVSERPGNQAAKIIGNLLEFGYEGDIYAVGRRPGKVHGIPILASVEMLPDGIDLAALLTPAALVPDLLDACGAKGIRWAVVESGGFTEFSEVGQELQQRICAVAEHWGIRFVGPNCMSVINMENGLCLFFAPLKHSLVKRGPVSVLAQSGGVSITYLHLFSEAGLGVNKVVSMGNKADLDEADYLEFLLRDPGTEIICLYLESIEEGRRLVELAASSSKPIIVHKANTGQASAGIAFSHSAALANDDRVVSAALEQAGVVRATSFSDAVTLAQGFALPPVRGNNLVVLSRSGGHAVIAADAAQNHGFRLMPIPDPFLERVRGMFTADVISASNPLDLGAIFDFDLYGQIVEECLRIVEPDALLLVHNYLAGAEESKARQLAARLHGLSQELSKPVGFYVFSQREEVEALRLLTPQPIFTEIEATVRALAASRDWHARRPAIRGIPTSVQPRPPAVDGLLSQGGVLTTDQALSLCASLNIPTADWAIASTCEEALEAAKRIGYPVALKAIAADISHKSDIGGVVLGVATPDALHREFDALVARANEHVSHDRARVLVQRMLSGGREVLLGGKRDPSFGPIVIFGLGGVYVEVFQDVTFRLAPLTREVAEGMISQVRASQLLYGVRGEQGVDIEAIVEALLALSRLLIACPEVTEIDINPLLAFPEGVAAVDARIVAGPPARPYNAT